MQVVEFAPQVSPAPGEPDCFIAAGFGPCLDQVGIGRVAIHLQDSGESGEVARHAIRTSAVFKTIGNHWRTGSAIGSVIPCVGPQPGFRDFPGTRGKGGQGRLVGEDPFALLDALQ